MFYSHQLLCKKGPLGQIWIAATMHPKINRKKTEQIDIEEICMQILQPQVPLALRLSGILMGGVVLVFHRKVTFLQDDVTEFLFKIKTAMSKKSSDYIISLPKGKSQARYENVTIKYDFNAFDEIERPMMRPITPEQHDCDHDVVLDKDYVIVTKPRTKSPPQLFDADGDHDEDAYRGPDHLRVASEDITLDDNNPGSSTDQFGDFGIDNLEERFPASDDPMDVDTFFPGVQLMGISTTDAPLESCPVKDLADETKAPPITANIQTNSTESQEPQPEQVPTIGSMQECPSLPEEPVGPESPEDVEVIAVAAPAQKKRRRQIRGKFKSVFDHQGTIPAPVFTSWLQDSDDIVGRNKIPKKDSRESWIEKLFQLPSTSLSRRSFIPVLAPDWTDELTSLWNKNFGPKSEGLGGKLKVQGPSPQASTVLPDTSVQGNHADSKSHSDPSNGPEPGEELCLSSPSETRANVEPAAEKNQEIPTDLNRLQHTLNSVERFRSGQLDLREYGSVEKLRAALRSPSTGSEDHFGGSQLGLTPSHSGQFATNNTGRRPGSHNRRLSTPGSAKLPFDVEVDPFTNGSGRFKQAQLSSPAIELGNFPADTYFDAENDIPAPDALGSSDYFATLRGTLRGSLTQFDLVEETTASISAQGSGKQHEFVNNVSGTVLQCLRENFNELGAQCKEHQSLDSLAQGMDRSQAAKLFYHILVLTSNSYVAVSQDVPFGDIRVSRGVYL